MLLRKVNRVLSEHADTPDLLSSLQNLSAFYKENNRENRHNLRNVLETQSQSINEEFVSTFSEMVDEFEKLAESVAELAKEAEQIDTILNQTEDATNVLISTTTQLRNQKTTIENRQRMVDSFLERFQLTDNELQIWNNFENNHKNAVKLPLFYVFYRMIQIRYHCKQMLTHYHQRTSLDILDRYAKKLETGYERLYRWVQKESRRLSVDLDELYLMNELRQRDTNDTIESLTMSLSPTAALSPKSDEWRPSIDDKYVDLELFSNALYQLRDRSGYFAHCCQELAQTRRVYWVERFIQALTRGEPTSTRPSPSRSDSISELSGGDKDIKSGKTRGKMSRPLEMHAHDPVRYLSDMLAWIHSALSQEREFSLQVYRVPNQVRKLVAAGTFHVKPTLVDETSDDVSSSLPASVEASANFQIINDDPYPPQDIIGYLDRVMEGLFRPLSTRIISVLNTQNKDYSLDVVTAYRVCHVLDFYTVTIKDLFHFSALQLLSMEDTRGRSVSAAANESDEKSSLLHDSVTPKSPKTDIDNPDAVKFANSMSDLRSMAYKKFYKMVENRMDKWVDSSSIAGHTGSSALSKASDILATVTNTSGINIGSDLSVGTVFKDHLDRLTDIMEIYSTSLVPQSLRVDDFTAVLNSFIDPMLEVAHKSVTNLTLTEKSVYLLNLLSLIIGALQKQSFTSQTARFETLSLLIETHKDKLVNHEATTILKECGVYPVLQALQKYQDKQKPESKPLAEAGELDEISMKMATKSLRVYIFSLSALSMPNVEKIKDPQMRSQVRNSVAHVIFSGYQSFYNALSDEKNGYKDVQSELTYSPQQVKQILQIH